MPLPCAFSIPLRVFERHRKWWVESSLATHPSRRPSSQAVQMALDLGNKRLPLQQHIKHDIDVEQNRVRSGANGSTFGHTLTCDALRSFAPHPRRKVAGRFPQQTGAALRVFRGAGSAADRQAPADQLGCKCASSTGHVESLAELDRSHFWQPWLCPLPSPS